MALHARKHPYVWVFHLSSSCESTVSPPGACLLRGKRGGKQGTRTPFSWAPYPQNKSFCVSPWFLHSSSAPASLMRRAVLGCSRRSYSCAFPAATATATSRQSAGPSHSIRIREVASAGRRCFQCSADHDNVHTVGAYLSYVVDSLLVFFAHPTVLIPSA